MEERLEKLSEYHPRWSKHLQKDEVLKEKDDEIAALKRRLADITNVVAPQKTD